MQSSGDNWNLKMQQMEIHLLQIFLLIAGTFLNFWCSWGLCMDNVTKNYEMSSGDHLLSMVVSKIILTMLFIVYCDIMFQLYLFAVHAKLFRTKSRKTFDQQNEFCSCSEAAFLKACCCWISGCNVFVAMFYICKFKCNQTFRRHEWSSWCRWLDIVL